MNFKSGDTQTNKQTNRHISLALVELLLSQLKSIVNCQVPNPVQVQSLQSSQYWTGPDSIILGPKINPPIQNSNYSLNPSHLSSFRIIPSMNFYTSKDLLWPIMFFYALPTELKPIIKPSCNISSSLTKNPSLNQFSLILSIVDMVKGSSLFFKC